MVRKRRAVVVLVVTVVVLLGGRIFTELSDAQRAPGMESDTAAITQSPNRAAYTIMVIEERDEDAQSSNITLNEGHVDLLPGSKYLQTGYESIKESQPVVDTVPHSMALQGRPPQRMEHVIMREKNRTPPSTSPHTRSSSTSFTLPPPQAPSLPGVGYVLALDYWEQQSSASRNLQNLQCWAAHLGLAVVEPQLQHSVLRTPLSFDQADRGYWFRDMVNIVTWNRLSSQHSHSQLTGWDIFISQAPRDVILVSFKHAFPSEIQKARKRLASESLGKPKLSVSARLQTGCQNKWTSRLDNLMKNGFRVVRKVCFNFGFGDWLTQEQFLEQLYGGLSPNTSTVVFSQWRGTGPPARVLISHPDCGNTRIQEEVDLSPQLLARVASYQTTFLHSQPYVAIMARMEKVKIAMKSDKINLDRHSLADCFGYILTQWRRHKFMNHLNTTFLAIDIGKYGSNSFLSSWDGSNLIAEFNKFFEAVFGVGRSVKDWEESFRYTVQSDNAGYVALLQKALVAQAQCVVFIGGGSFQKHALQLYRQTHPLPQDQCVSIVSECTPKSNLDQET